MFSLTGEDAFLGVLDMSAVMFVQSEKGIQWQTLAGQAQHVPIRHRSCPCHMGENFELLQCIPFSESQHVNDMQEASHFSDLFIPAPLLEGPEVTRETVEKFFALDDTCLDRKLHSAVCLTWSPTLAKGHSMSRCMLLKPFGME